MTPTKWRAPRTGDSPLRAKFHNGIVSKEALPASKWVWADRNYDWDIVEVEIENAKKSDGASTWTPTSGGY